MGDTFAYEEPARPDVVRAAAEEIGILAVGLVEYEFLAQENSADWDNPASADTLLKKLGGRAWSFDTNPFVTNFLTHLSGAVYYSAARSNRLSIPLSLLLTAAASTTWEIVGEIRENASVNDAIYTPIAGAALGESLFQLGAYFDARPASFGARALGTIFGPFKTVHDAIDRVHPRRSSEPIAHEFRIDQGAGIAIQSARASADYHAGIGTRIVRIRDYDRPGYGGVGFHDGNVSAIRFDGTFFEGGIADLDFRTDVLFAGAYERRATWATLAGAGVGLEIAEHRWDRTRSRMDAIATARVVEAAIEPTFFFGGTRLRTSLLLSGNFAGVTPLVVPLPADDLPTVVNRQGYYYAVGGTLAPGVELRTGHADIGGSVEVDGFLGLRGWDRFPSPTRATAALSDARMRANAWVTWRATSWLAATARLAYGFRTGAIDGVSATTDETRAGLDVALVF